MNHFSNEGILNDFKSLNDDNRKIILINLEKDSLDKDRIKNLLFLTDFQLENLDTNGNIFHIDKKFYPCFQFTSNGFVQGIDLILEQFCYKTDKILIYLWLTTRNEKLAINEKYFSPLEWLRAGFYWKHVKKLAIDLNKKANKF